MMSVELCQFSHCKPLLKSPEPLQQPSYTAIYFLTQALEHVVWLILLLTHY